MSQFNPLRVIALACLSAVSATAFTCSAQVPATAAAAVAPQAASDFVGRFNNKAAGFSLELKLDDHNLIAGMLTVDDQDSEKPIQIAIADGKFEGGVLNAFATTPGGISLKFAATLDHGRMTITQGDESVIFDREMEMKSHAVPNHVNAADRLDANLANDGGKVVATHPALPVNLTGDFGITLDRIKKDGTVGSVADYSPAARNGVKPGMMLIAINNDGIDGKTFDEVDAMLKGRVGTNLSVSFRCEDGANLLVSCPRERLDLCSLMAETKFEFEATHPTGALWTIGVPLGTTSSGDAGAYYVDTGMIGVEATVTQSDLPAKASGLDAKAFFEKQYKTGLPKGPVVGEGHTIKAADIGGVADAYAVQFTTTDGVSTQQHIAVLSIVDGKLIVADFSTEEYTPESAQEVMEHLQKSFKLSRS